MSDVTRATAAATSIAASFGLPANNAIVLHNSDKLTLRLLPCDVLARVAPAARQVAQLEVALAGRVKRDRDGRELTVVYVEDRRA